VPDHHASLSADRRFRETFHRMRWGRGRQRSLRYLRMEEQILEVVKRQTTFSTRCLAVRTGTSYSFVYCTLQEQMLYLYLIHPVQELVANDAHARRTFCQ
jgi:hypothetical protein